MLGLNAVRPIMATTPLRSARSSSELSSVRDDYSSWLDAIFPPSRGHSQHQHPAKARQQQAIIAGQLRNALPLELPRPSTQFVARHGTQDERSNDGDRTKGCVTRGTRRDSSSKRRPPALSLTELSSSLALNYSIGHRHRRQRQGGRHCGQASLVTSRTFSSTLPASTNHPATFSDVRYSNRRSSHRPGLSFFEHIPTQALGGVACTLVFLAPDAATRAGGEVLWLRVNAAGKTQRRVFAKAGCFRSNPRLCRRVALSLSGRHGNENIAGKAQTIGSSGENIGLTKDPAALLKIFRPDNVNNYSSLNTDNDSTRVCNAKPGGRGGGCTDVRLINTVSDIEHVLVNVGDEPGIAPTEGDSEGDAAPPPLQQRQQLPRQIITHYPGRLDYGFVPRTTPRHDASSPVATQRGGGASPDAVTPTTGPNQAGPITDEQPTAAPYAGCSRSPAGPAATEAETGGAANLQMCSANARGVRRPRPWAVQRFLRPKGPLAWMVRVVWRRHRDSFCWIVSDSDPYITSDVFHGGGTICGANACSAVRSTAGWEAPKVFVAGLVEKLEAETAVTDAATPRAPPRFEKLVADLIQDGEGKWWLTQVKAFRLLRSTERAPSSGSTPSTNACAPSNSAAASVLTSSRLRKGSEEGGHQTQGEDHESEGSAPNAQASRTRGNEAEDEEPQRCRRRVPRDRSRGAEAADRACSAGSARRARTVGVHPSEDAHPGPVRPRAARFINTSKSFCPGLFCGTETRGKGKQRQPRERERLSASPKIGRGVREEADCGMGADADRAGRSQEGSTDTLVDALGPAVDEEAGNLDENFAAGDEPMFPLPLKALFVNEEVVEFRKRSLARQKLEALSAAGEPEGPASTRGSSAAAPTDFSTPPSERGALSSCSYQASRVTERDDASLVEARALAALRQRDRAVLYDTVQLCGACYRVYSENWRWWLARGVENDRTVKPQPGHTPPLALVAGALDNPGSKRRREGRRKRQERQPSLRASATRTGTEAGVDGVMSSGVAATSGEIRWKAGGSVRPSDASLSLWLSPTGLPGDAELTRGGQEGGGNEDSVHRIDKGGENVGAVVSVPFEHSPFPQGDRPTGKSRSTINARAVRRQGDTSTIPAVALEGKPSCKQNGRGGPPGKPPTSTANAFRARLDGRLSGISIQGSGRQRADDRSERGSDVGASPVEGAAEKARPASPPFVLASANSKPTLVAAAAAAAGTAAATAATHAPGHGGSDEFVHETSCMFAGEALRNADGGPAASAIRAVAATTEREAASEDCATPPQAGALSIRPWEWENVSLDWKSTERA